MDLQSSDFDRLLLFEHARKEAEASYAANPLDIDNLTRWAGALLELSHFQNVTESKKMIQDAMSKLDEALVVNPKKRETLWCLGNAQTLFAFFTPDMEEAKEYFDKAADCFQLADEEPTNEYYCKSLEVAFKASIWCGKHLKTLLSTEESQEEAHRELFFRVEIVRPVLLLLRERAKQLLFDVLNFSAACYSCLSRCSISVEREVMDVTERFILEQLNLTRDIVSESKRISSHGTEVIKGAQLVIDGVVRLCGSYAQATDWSSASNKLEEKNRQCKGMYTIEIDHVTNITRCTIEKLQEIGVIAANNGGSLVTILNVSWKGVVTLLQLGDGALALKVNVSEIIAILISLVNQSLKSASETWCSSSLKEAVSATEARRKFLPVKFYLVNAVKIATLYPCQAYTIHGDLTHCLLTISAFKLSMSNVKLLKTATEVYAELLDKTSFDLLNSILRSDQVLPSLKVEVLDSVFVDESLENREATDHSSFSTLDELFFSGVRTLLLDRVALFLILLRHSSDLADEMKNEIARKLKWILNSLIDEDVYSCVLVLRIPVSCSSGKNVKLVWQPIYSSLLDALKAFTVVASSSSAWSETESFLLENLLHPHFLCWDIVMELWCFITRYSEPKMLSRVIDKLCLLMKLVANATPVLPVDSGMRRIARSVSMLVSFGTQSVVDQVFKSIIGDDLSQLTSAVCLNLFMEGFPLNRLSDKMRGIATQRLLSDYYGFIHKFDDNSEKTCKDGVFGGPIFALSATLQFLPVGLSDIDVKTLKFIISIIQKYRVSSDKAAKEQCCKLLSETLGIISNTKHLYESDEIERVVFELENIFLEDSDKALYACKPSLALFIAGLAHMRMTISDQKSKFSAALALHHVMLRERHWALAHLAVTAFGYFSERTSCDELWRFVPQDAALSYDLSFGSEANEERFMEEFKAFLDKEATLDSDTFNTEQLRLLVKEGLALKEMARTVSVVTEAVSYESMEIDREKTQSRKRKVPDGIGKGVELLQSGLEVIVTGISQWRQSQPESSELRDEFMSHCSRLEDEIARLVGLADGA